MLLKVMSNFHVLALPLRLDAIPVGDEDDSNGPFYKLPPTFQAGAVIEIEMSSDSPYDLEAGDVIVYRTQDVVGAPVQISKDRALKHSRSLDDVGVGEEDLDLWNPAHIVFYEDILMRPTEPSVLTRPNEGEWVSDDYTVEWDGNKTTLYLNQDFKESSEGDQGGSFHTRTGSPPPAIDQDDSTATIISDEDQHGEDDA